MSQLFSPRPILSGIISAVILAVFASGSAQAQTAAASATQPSPNLAGIAHIAVRVHDLDASVAFYKKLGFVEAFALSRNGAVYEAFFKINDRQYMELYPADAKNPQTGFLHVCFEGADLQAAHDFYVSEGLTPNAVRKAGAGNLLFTMPGPATPTGPQNLEYTQYMPGSMHSKDFGQHLGAERIGDLMTGVKLAVGDPAGAKAFYLTKLGFDAVAGSDSVVALPGNPEEKIEFAPKSPQGFKSSIVLQVTDLASVGNVLGQRGIKPAEKTVKGMTIADPDGNEIVLAPKMATAVALR